MSMWLMTYRMANWYCAHTSHLTLLPWLLGRPGLPGETTKLDDLHKDDFHKKERRSVETPKRNFRGTDYDPRADRGGICTRAPPACLEYTATPSAAHPCAPDHYTA